MNIAKVAVLFLVFGFIGGTAQCWQYSLWYRFSLKTIK